MTELPASTTLSASGGVRPASLVPLPLGALRPMGWLADRLRAQVDGMAGHLDEHWPSVRDSSWIGGDQDGWERLPYWLDGVIPLAAITRDEDLMPRIGRMIDHILDHQEPSGWMGPHHGDRDGWSDQRDDLDVWPRMPLLKALLQWRAATGDPRIVPAAHALGLEIGRVLERHPLFSWGYYRVADLIATLQDLYELTGDEELLDVARIAERQAYDWTGFADEMPTTKVTLAEIESWGDAEGKQLAHRTMLSHGVNIAMGLKWMPVLWRNGHDDDARAQLGRMLAALDRHHGQPNGLYSADEHLGGRHPSQGTETCAVVEAMFSLEKAIETWGPDEALLERLERIAFNALPASATADDTAHQYDQQANQVLCAVIEDRIYTSNGPDANIFGLEPHFGCCTANRHQGWPKFAARLWMRDTDDDGLTALSYAPTEVVDEREDGTLAVEVSGGYPFGEEVRISVRADRTLRRPLHLRIPGWADGATLRIDDEEREVRPGTTTTVDREWSTEAVELALRLPAPVVVRGDDVVTVESGPLLFALPVDERWVPIAEHGWVTDHEVDPASRWARGLAAESLRGLVRTPLDAEDGASPFSPSGAPVGIGATARNVAEWDLEHGAAAAPPAPAIASGEAHPVTLLPYGAARLRLTAIPVVR